MTAPPAPWQAGVPIQCRGSTAAIARRRWSSALQAIAAGDVDVDAGYIPGIEQVLHRLRDVEHFARAAKRHGLANLLGGWEVDGIIELAGRHHVDADLARGVAGGQRSGQREEARLADVI